jgi:hypothetical protein
VFEGLTLPSNDTSVSNGQLGDVRVNGERP